MRTLLHTALGVVVIAVALYITGYAYHNHYCWQTITTDVIFAAFFFWWILNFPVELKSFDYSENWALGMAIQASLRSPCKSKRGVVIWNRQTGLVSEGCNAPPIPFKCDGTDACKASCSKTAVHAEQAAILAIPAEQEYPLEMIHVKTVNGEAVPSDKPSCWQCSKLILQSKIQYMWLLKEEGLVRYTAEEFHKQTLANNNL